MRRRTPRARGSRHRPAACCTCDTASPPSTNTDVSPSLRTDSTRGCTTRGRGPGGTRRARGATGLPVEDDDAAAAGADPRLDDRGREGRDRRGKLALSSATTVGTTGVVRRLEVDEVGLVGVPREGRGAVDQRRPDLAGPGEELLAAGLVVPGAPRSTSRAAAQSDARVVPRRPSRRRRRGGASSSTSRSAGLTVGQGGAGHQQHVSHAARQLAQRGAAGRGGTPPSSSGPPTRSSTSTAARCSTAVSP